MSSDWASKDFYAVLGVDKKADGVAIKKAYRKLARENHPDSKPGDKAAEERFKDISEAYSVLSDDKKRKEYDEQRTLFGQFKNGFGAGGAGAGWGAGQPGAGPQFDFDISDLLGGVFGGGGRRRGRAPQARRGTDLESEATIGFEQALDGVTIPLRMTSEAPCGTCNGTGAEPGTVPVVCPQCQGSGMMTSATGGVFAMTEPCDLCRGRGLVVEHPCKTCGGSGRSPSTRTLQVRVPAGVKDGQRIRLKGKGGQGENGGPDGDLILLVHVEPHKLFGRKADNLTVTVPITFDEAVLGANIRVPTLGGAPVTIKVPAGTPGGRTFRARGKGAPKRSRSGGADAKGDLLVTVEIDIPREPDEATRAAAEAMRAARGVEDPRARMEVS